MSLQTDLFAPSTVQKFEAWKASPGGAQVMRIIYAIAARYGRRYIQTGRHVSMKLLWEICRDNIIFIKARMKAKGINLEKMDGFALNNIFTSLIARHIMSHRPEWKNLFETRELGVQRNRRRVTVLRIEQPVLEGRRA